MATPKGYPSQEKEDRLSAEFVTVSPAGFQKHALDVSDKSVVSVLASDAVEANSTTSVINATSHVALKGDKIRFTSGVNNTIEVDVYSVTANTITLGQTLTTAPSAADTFDILRPTSLTVAADGTITTSSGPVQFVQDGSNVTVNEDTVTPANNRPLPVKLTGLDGDVVINSSNLHLDVQLDHDSANPDSVQIGDGTETVAINASNEMQVRDDDANTSLSTIAGDTTSLDTKTPALGAALIAASTPVNIASDQTVPISAASLPLPSGAATEATLSTVAGDTTSIDGKTPALGSAVTAASVPVNIASDQTVPISAASLPLPSGAATEATLGSVDSTLTAIDADTSTLAGAVSGNEMQVDVVASLPAGTNNIGDVDIASALPSGTNTIGAVDLNLLDVFATTYTDASSTNIPGNATNPVQLIASTSTAIQKIQVADTTGAFLEIMTGAAASEVRKVLIGPGSDSTVEVAIPASTRISVRRVDSATALSVGSLAVNYLG